MSGAGYRLMRAACLIGLLAAMPILVVFAEAGAVASPQAGGSVVSEAEYWALVEHSLEFIPGLRDLSPGQARLALADLAGRWARIESIQLADGRLEPIESGVLLSALRAETPEPERIESLLQTLQSAHLDYPRGVFEPDDLESLRQILAGPEFQWQEAQPNPLAEWFNRLWARITEWLNQMSGDREAGISIGGATWSPLTIVTSILLALILLYVFRNLWLDLAAEARLDQDSDPADVILTSHSAYKKAQELSRGGDYRSAVRYLYLSSLLLLDERGLLRYDRSKTNREYLRSLSADSGLAAPLREVIEIFDDVWYGNHALNEESFRLYSDRVQQLKDRRP